MKKRLLGIATIIVAALFLLTPMSAMSSISAVDEKPAPSVSVIPQSEFVIDLGENEKVVWTADYVTRDDDVAYVTMQTTVESEELEGQMVIPPQPLAIWHRLNYAIWAKNWWGLPLFGAWAKGWARFNYLGICTYIIDSSGGITLSWRYCNPPDGGWNHYTEGVGEDYAKITADAYWIDKLRRRIPHIHVWAKYPDWDGGGGYLEWDS